MSIPLPYSPYPSFQAQCGAVRCDSCEVKSMLDRVVFRGDVLPFNDSIQWFHGCLPVVSSGVWMMLGLVAFSPWNFVVSLSVRVLFCFLAFVGCGSPIACLLSKVVSPPWRRVLRSEWIFFIIVICALRLEFSFSLSLSGELVWSLTMLMSLVMMNSCWNNLLICMRKDIRWERHLIWCIGEASRLSKSWWLVMSSLDRRAWWLVPHVSVCQPSPVGSAQQSKVKVDFDCCHVDEGDECSRFMSRGWDRWYRFVKSWCGLECWDLMWPKAEGAERLVVVECWEMTGRCALKFPYCNPERSLLSGFTTM